MTRIESELHDLYEDLMHNDDMADRDTYYTIVGIANDVAEVEAENEKLRDAMYSNAKRHALQHMDADELRIWATQQAELIDALRKLAKDMYPSYVFANGALSETHLTYEQDTAIRARVRELGVLDE